MIEVSHVSEMSYVCEGSESSYVHAIGIIPVLADNIKRISLLFI